MAKPSIFSKDYEKKMKRRRLKIIGIVILVVVVSLGLFYKIKLKDMSFNQMIYNLQVWVNSDSTQGSDNQHKENVENTAPKQEQTEQPKVEEVKDVNLSFELLKGEKVQFKIEEANENKIFKEMIGNEYTYDISPSKKEAVVLDKNQNMFLVNVDGAVKNITSEEYISKAGDKYPKDVMLDREKKAGVDYLWGTDPKFIDDNTIVYKSNLPYFGASAKNQYLWIINLKDNKSYTVFKSAAKNIEILGADLDENGINVKIDNQEYILDNQGKLFKG